MLSGSISVHADTLTQNFNTGAFVASSTQQETPILVNQFNPTLGVLDSVSATLGGSYGTVVTTEDSSFTYGLFLVGSEEIAEGFDFEAHTGTYMTSSSGTTTYGPNLNYLTGPGQVDINFCYDGATLAPDTSAGFAGTLT